MTYTEWRDELKSNLLCVSESERRRVLDYYAEAYADRREAGYSEREIIQEFGAPYDAAQRILSDNRNGESYGEVNEERDGRPRRRRKENGESDYAPPPPPPDYNSATPDYNSAPPAKKKNDSTWVFVLLCIVFAVPIFGVIMAMVGITIGFCVAPIGVIISGGSLIGASIGAMIGGSAAYGLFSMGIGIIVLGVGIILCPLFFKLVSLMWKLFNEFFAWLKCLFSGKERA